MTQVRISALWLYPVKSLAGCQVSSAVIGATGIKGDRQWMLVDEQGLFVSQRKLPLLATIAPSFSPTGVLQLTDANGNTIAVAPPNGEPQPVRIWRDDCFGKVANEEVNQWLTQAAGSPAPLTLVEFDYGHSRPTDTQRFGPYSTYFADAAPLLVANNAALIALNEHLHKQGRAAVDMRRFRPNIVVEGLAAFAEHNYSQLQHSTLPITIALRDHCQRCSVITVDQTTGIPSKDTSPFRELAQINSMPGKPKAPAFGVNSVLLEGDGERIACGDVLEVVGG